MSLGQDQQRVFGPMGGKFPSVLFGTAALGNGYRAITEQAKVEIIGEWFRHVRPPVFVEVAYEHGEGMALEVLGRVLRRLEIPGKEIVIQLVVGRSSGSLFECWEKSCRLLGDVYRPQLIAVSIEDAGALRVAQELKAAGQVRGVGLVVSSLEAGEQATKQPSFLAELAEVDSFTLADGCTVMRHPPQAMAILADLAERQIPAIVAGVLEGGFLVGGNKLAGRMLQVNDDADRSILAWRKSFVALCDGHGISPAHASIQFALALPGVAAVKIESTYADRVAANIRSALIKVPDHFWASMKEEGLLEADYPFLG